jgi:F-type H+-transporting ATPase subunit gamma
MKTIKRRIKSVGSTLQITKAMEMVASSKLRRAKKRAEQMRPYFTALESMLTDIAAQKADFKTILTVKREVRNRLFIVVAGDRGLAGGFNSNIIRLVNSFDNKDLPLPKIIAIGRRTAEYFRKKGNELVAEFPYFSENVKASKCADIADMAVGMFRAGDVDEVRIFYTAFISALNQEATEHGLLPYEPLKKDEPADPGSPGTPKNVITNYDPSPEAVFDRIIPKLLLSVVSGACVESFASEQSARRNAMENASDNAEEMIEKLSLQYNRARQEKITNEINEIVGGANAIS